MAGMNFQSRSGANTLWKGIHGTAAGCGRGGYMLQLKNEFMQMEADENGRIIFLANCQGKKKNVIQRPEPDLFLVNIKKGDCWENPVWGHDQKPETKITGNSMEISYPSLMISHTNETVDIGLRLFITLKGEEIRFDAEIDNRTQNCEVTDFEFPRIGQIKSLGSGVPSLLWPVQSGQCYPRIGEYLANMGCSREIDHNSIDTGYPGSDGSMQWMALTEGEETLYFSGRDGEFYSSGMCVRGSREEQGAVTLLFNKLAFVKPQESWNCPPYVLRLYSGSWREGAKDYADWISSFRPDMEQSGWVREMQGYFLVINKQQFGYEMWNYNQLPQLYEMAKEHGCDALGLFGWYDSGHDNQYPDLKVSESLGGRAELEENIKKVQEAGGHVTLYQQGHLIDPTAEFYRIKGHRLESKSRTGLPYYERYFKSHKSQFLHNYTNKIFTTACPSCPEWQELMEEKTDYAASFGPDGMLFDQIGGMYPYPCFDESHPHEKGKPSLSMSAGRRKLLSRMRERARVNGREFAFFSEHITDIYSAYLDCVHGIGSAPSAEGDRKKAADGGLLSGPLNYPELFRYTFPETIITIRNSAPFLSIRHVNYAAVFGFRFEMEIRYQDDCDDILADRWPEERIYAKKVSDLRRRYWDVLGYGRFTDEENIRNGNAAMIVKGFKKEDCLAVIMWNDTDSEARVDIGIDGYQIVEIADTEGNRDELPRLMKSQEIVLVICRKV